MKTALFDFDGVVVDTEPIYDIFWNAAAEKYKVDIDNFAHVIKGTTLPFIMEKYFSDFPQALRQQIHDESIAYEKDMPIPPMPGSLEFIRMWKANGVQLGLVTSSDEAKVRRAFRLLSLGGLFDTLVTADRITRSKPDPMCYLQAASDLQVAPEDCLVFEIAWYSRIPLPASGRHARDRDARDRTKHHQSGPGFERQGIQSDPGFS